MSFQYQVSTGNAEAGWEIAPSENAWWVFGVLIAATCYQFVLCFLNTAGYGISAALVGMSEVIILAACLPTLLRNIPIRMALLMSAILINFLLLTLIRGEIDAKGLRDMLLAAVFFWFGWNLRRAEIIDRLLIMLSLIVIIFGVFEWASLDLYTKFFNTYRYYVSQGGIHDGHAMIQGQALTLNGFRPEDIGRTILPGLLGSHRISSVFLEPVSMGNFATLIVVWALSKKEASFRTMGVFFVAAAIMVTMADSRFGLIMIACLCVYRLVFPRGGGPFVFLLPILLVVFLTFMGIWSLGLGQGDNIIGRLARTGVVLSEMDVSTLLGIQTPLENYGDMGYAYVLSRFGAVFALALWGALWLLPFKTDSQAARFRAMGGLYMVMILSISGTSLFALKTAGLFWFVFGSLAVRDLQWPDETDPVYLASDNSNKE